MLTDSDITLLCILVIEQMARRSNILAFKEKLEALAYELRGRRLQSPCRISVESQKSD